MVLAHVKRPLTAGNGRPHDARQHTVTDNPTDLPLWLRASIVTFLTLLLGGSVVADIYVPAYAAGGGQFITLALIGLVGAAIGVARSLTGGDKK